MKWLWHFNKIWTATAVFALSFAAFLVLKSCHRRSMHPLVPVQNKYTTSSKGSKHPPKSSNYIFRSTCMRYLLPLGHSVSYANSAVKQLPLILSRWSAPNSPIQTARLAILHYCATALRSDYCTTHRQKHSLKAVEPTELIQNGKSLMECWESKLLKWFCEQPVTRPFSD